MNCKFYWECRGDNYPFEANKKYLIYFKGCFSPCHRGHFETIERFTKLGNNIYALIHQIGSEKRHGIPYHMNRKIWKTYIKELLPQDRVYLFRYECRDDIFDLPDLSTFDRIIHIRGNEDYDMSAMENKHRKRFKYLSEKLLKLNIGLDFYYLDRPYAKALCATEFIKELIRTKKKCRRFDCDCKYKRLKEFFPENLSRETAVKLTNRIQKYYLTI